MKSNLKQVLNEEVTETNGLYWRLPKKFIDELGVKLYKKDDPVWVVEIHFDTRQVVFEVDTIDQFGDLVCYDDSHEVPSSYKGWYKKDIDGLSQEFKNFIFRRLHPKWLKYLF